MNNTYLTNDDIKTLTTLNANQTRYAKRDQTYLNALETVIPSINRNDAPLTENKMLKAAPLNDFSFNGKEDFIKVCELDATPLSFDAKGLRHNEKIVPQNFTSKTNERIYKKAQGITYMLTYTGADDIERLIKIGCTNKTMKERISSYNCGTINARKGGTCSTTNYRFLQTIVASSRPLGLYIADFSWDTKPIDWHGHKSVPIASPLPHAVEDIIVKKYKEQFSTLPCGNIQADASTK